MTPRPRKHIPKIRAVIYTRVSSEAQAESGLSLEHQLTKCRALATVHDYTIVDEITDAGQSAASLDRPGMARILAMVKARKIEAVIVAKLDRITRSVRDLADLLERFSKAHVALVSASDSLNTESAGGRMVLNVMMSVAQWEREAIGERTRDALTTKRARGERVSRHAPYGYRFVQASAGTEGRKKGQPLHRLEKDARELTVVAIMQDCAAAGFSHSDIADELNRLGHTTRSGVPWVKQYVRNVLDKHGTITTMEAR